ncbi:MAG: Integrase core domain protein [Firmicutes bacterium ADurb.Bin182]|nr:MAG: Integrase core domain protein [Firmicutes bacterium ADurb.Bin182]
MGQEQDIKKCGKWKQVTEKERYQIEGFRRFGMSVSGIARQLKRDRRTIQRELKRGSVVQNVEWELKELYCADAGQRVHRVCGANKGRGLKIGHCHKLAEYLEQKIVREKYSPDAAIGRLKAEGRDLGVTICTKTVYNYIDSGIFAGISNKDLPVKKKGKKRNCQPRVVALNNLKGRSIEERPEVANQREESGHWEMDCVESGRGSKATLLVLTERTGRGELIFKMKAQTQECVEDVLNRLERKHKGKFSMLFKSITVDNGPEFLCCRRLEASSLRQQTKRTTIYYAHPYSAWERGSNENANKLIRRFIPKGADIAKYSERDIKRIERWMNSYPRRLLGYRTPAEVSATVGDCFR